MDHVDITVNRLHSHSGCMIGELRVNNVRICYSLELPWLWNDNYVSCIPNGRYRSFIRTDHQDGWRIELLNVPGGRTHVQLHIGNIPKDSLGCVLVGTSYTSNSVGDSRTAYRLLKKAIYGTEDYASSMVKDITVEFMGIQATPWGDFPSPSSGNRPA